MVVYEDGEAVAGGGLRRLGTDVAEIKRMFVAPSARGRGHGRRVLDELEAAAAELGYRRLRLDTAQSMTTAIALYRSAGYRRHPGLQRQQLRVVLGREGLRRDAEARAVSAVGASTPAFASPS